MSDIKLDSLKLSADFTKTLEPLSESMKALFNQQSIIQSSMLAAGLSSKTFNESFANSREAMNKAVLSAVGQLNTGESIISMSNSMQSLGDSIVKSESISYALSLFSESIKIINDSFAVTLPSIDIERYMGKTVSERLNKSITKIIDNIDVPLPPGINEPAQVVKEQASRKERLKIKQALEMLVIIMSIFQFIFDLIPDQSTIQMQSDIHAIQQEIVEMNEAMQEMNSYLEQLIEIEEHQLSVEESESSPEEPEPSLQDDE